MSNDTPKKKKVVKKKVDGPKMVTTEQASRQYVLRELGDKKGHRVLWHSMFNESLDELLKLNEDSSLSQASDLGEFNVRYGIGPHASLSIISSVTYDLNEALPITDLFLPTKTIKTDTDVLGEFATFPLAGRPTEISMVVESSHASRTGYPIYIHIQDEDTEDLYKSLFLILTAARMNPAIRMDTDDYTRCDWYGVSAGYNRQALRLAAYKGDVHVLRMMRAMAYAQTSYELEKTVNVSGMNSVKVASVMPLLISELPPERRLRLDHIRSISNVPADWTTLEEARLFMQQVSAYRI